MLSGSSVAIVASDVGQLLGLVSVLVDLGQRPDEARPFVRLGYADLLRKKATALNVRSDGSISGRTRV